MKTFVGVLLIAIGMAAATGIVLTKIIDNSTEISGYEYERLAETVGKDEEFKWQVAMFLKDGWISKAEYESLYSQKGKRDLDAILSRSTAAEMIR